jgi:hypothetical protein
MAKTLHAKANDFRDWVFMARMFIGSYCVTDERAIQPDV